MLVWNYKLKMVIKVLSIIIIAQELLMNIFQNSLATPNRKCNKYKKRTFKVIPMSK